MNIEELVEAVQKYDKSAHAELIKKAYTFSKKAHEGQKRESGEDYFSHPLEVSKILLEMKADGPSICAALLHDVIEDGVADIRDIHKEFGDEITTLVEGVTKTAKITYQSQAERAAENLRRMLIATTRDIRIILIKLADRLHNMRTLKHKQPDKQKMIAQETLDIYAPLAHKFGLYPIKGELEDLSLRYLNPEAYEEIKQKVHEKREERDKKTQLIIDTLKQKLTEGNIEYADISGRAKYFYSIYKKMITEHKSFEEMYDLFAFRILVHNPEDCYKVIAIVHQLWKPMPGRFKDYIAVPKSNGYQSLHTSVVTPFDMAIEIQTRTVEMDNVARYGVAAHWRYKGTERDKQFDKRMAWFEQILDWKRKTAHEFIESLKVDLFRDEIVVFTPKGDPVILPEGATPLDFAYAVHSDVGNHCVRAEVNKKVVGLDAELKSGDIINIMTSNKMTVSRNWLHIAKTSKARQKIRGGLGIEGDDRSGRKEEHEESIDIAKYIVCADKAPIKIAKCCLPKIQDDAIGIKTKDGIITLHKKICQNCANIEQNKLVPITWNVPKEIIKTMYVYVQDEYGVVKQILDVLADAGIVVLSINMRPHRLQAAIILQIKADTQETVERVEKLLLDSSPHVTSVRLEDIQ